ncbi:hypothetical protein BVC80_209g177 [Macleaya cordata]|uniref:Uncharacterized protein n=1 Tax=Macleaya cordata TaxID=56857 RepID=A0A200QDD9_MACCD|nr:hypothetical protein BVC80_209g177 [Macleaya cordata]
MSDEGPKLYSTKPKKSQLKQQSKVKGMSSSPAPNPMDPPAPPPPPPSASSSSSSSGLPPHKESFARRYKFVWPLLLTVNLAIGAYLFVRTKNKGTVVEDGEVAADVPSTPVASTTAPIPEQLITEPVKVPKPTPELVKVQKSIPVDQQRELYKWMLEEKRKIKPKNPEEKKKVDEEKAILKQFIRAKSIPSI